MGVDVAQQFQQGGTIFVLVEEDGTMGLVDEQIGGSGTSDVVAFKVFSGGGQVLFVATLLLHQQALVEDLSDIDRQADTGELRDIIIIGAAHAVQLEPS